MSLGSSCHGFLHAIVNQLHGIARDVGPMMVFGSGITGRQAVRARAEHRRNSSRICVE